jgi:hypothetical protein
MKKNFMEDPRILELIARYEAFGVDHTHETADKAAVDLINEIALIHYGIESSPDKEKQHFLSWLKNKMGNLDTNNPRSNDAEKAIRRLGHTKYGEASKYLEDLLSLRKEDYSEIQRVRASGQRPLNPLNKRILEILLIQPDISEKDLIKKLKSEIGQGVIEDCDEDSLSVLDKNKKNESISVSIGGIKNRLSRLKKQLKK